MRAWSTYNRVPMPSKVIKLSEAGRLRPADARFAKFAEQIVFVDGRLIASTFDARARRVVLFTFGLDAAGVWNELGRFEVPFDCPKATGERDDWTRVELLVSGKNTLDVRVNHEITVRFGGDASTNTESSWSGKLDLLSGVSGELTPSNTASRFIGGTDGVSLHLLGGNVIVQTSDGHQTVLTDPDNDAKSNFGIAAVVVGSSIWIAASGLSGSTFEPRLHAFDLHTGKLQRTLKLGTEAAPGLGWNVRVWKDGLLLSSLWRGQAAYLPLESGVPTFFAGPKWESTQFGSVWGMTNVACGDGFAAIGTPYASSRAGAALLLDSDNEAFAQLKLSDARKEDLLGDEVAAWGPWLAVRFQRGDIAAIQIVHVEKKAVTEAKVATKLGGSMDPEALFEAVYPGFLASKEPASKFKQWQLKAAVYSCLAEEGHLPPFDLEEFARLYPKRKIDPEKHGLVKEAVAYLRFREEPDALLSKLNKLVFDGGNELYAQLFPYWGGEDSTFDVKSFEGIEHCGGLTEIVINSCVGAADLAPLAQLPNLKALTLQPGPAKNLRALAESKSLKRLELWDTTAKKQAKDLDILRAAGMEISVQDLVHVE